MKNYLLEAIHIEKSDPKVQLKTIDEYETPEVLEATFGRKSKIQSPF